ncbi:hypothetical protein K456DRAFT_1759485 [Colletotrichum gloeosporioides 23]|nr:hypothetical protein K456DRAFT_1759485 [Colletotrichum gloeosporioides 23]
MLKPSPCLLTVSAEAASTEDFCPTDWVTGNCTVWVAMATVGTTVLAQCIDTFVTSDREYLSSQVPTGTFRCSVAFFGHYFHLLRLLADALELDDCAEFPGHPEYEGLLSVSLVPWHWSIWYIPLDSSSHDFSGSHYSLLGGSSLP